MTSAPYAALAFLLAGPDQPAVLVDATPRWVVALAANGRAEPTALWGHPPLPSSISAAETLAAAARREVALLRMRLPWHPTARAVHRLRPSPSDRGAVAEMVRRALRAGAIVEMGEGADSPRLLDLAAAEAAVRGPVTSIRAGTGGVALAEVIGAEGGPALLRVARAGGPGDPANAAEALRRLTTTSLVPRLLGAGAVAGASWTLESRLLGRRPRQLSYRLWEDARNFCAGLPRQPGPPTAHRADLTAIAAALPRHTAALARTSGIVDAAVDGLPAVERHGDLWTGNLLVKGGTLQGVIDWDAAHPRGIPGVDLLKLYATAQRRRAGTSLGGMWSRRPWNDCLFRTAMREYWVSVEMQPPCDELHEALGLAWWAGEVAGTIQRVPHRGEDRQWLDANVESVLARLP